MAITGPQDDGLGGPTVTRDPLIGQLLGEYRVLSRLGEGAMGVVYRGEQQLLRKPVAIKVLKPGHSDAANVQQLLEEARAVTAAHHPNIIDIFSFGQAPTGQQYFVMECLEGEPLDVWAQNQGGKVKVADALIILEQIVAGLGAAHTAGVIHRDLKPGNIFYATLHDGSRFVKLLDFGLAKRAAPNAGVRGTSIVGTPLYMAPEQATHGELGPWTDLYALGCIAYELISGAPPFAGPNVIATLELHATAAPKPLADPNVPAELEALIFELLEKQSARRPKSAAVVKRTLERIGRQLSTARTRATGVRALTGDDEPQAPTQVHRPITGPVPEVGQKESVTTQVEARSLKAPALGAAVLVLVGLLAFGAWKLRPQPPPVPPVVEAPRPPSPPVEDAVPVPDPSPAPKPKVRPTTKGHSTEEGRARLGRLRAKLDLGSGTGRSAKLDLDDMEDTLTGEKLWQALDAYEDLHK